ncbi:MAG: tRNA (adenine-N1)-methyltransferase [candidate division WOR-3 bacterium]|nr:tRNA (adenine-N1)-methyltransferase [candidate division WOR-3 bacterium]
MLKPSDLILIYHGEKAKYLLTLPQTGKFSTHKGDIDLTRILGKEYGDAIKSHTGDVFYILKPTLADMAMKVRRTTTIVYPKDAGMMLLRTAVFPGAKVIEVGSGSGALTLILANFVRPEGRVYSYEVRKEFLENAKANVRRFGLEQWVEFVEADVEKQGFLHKEADAIFIDLPEPWGVINWAHQTLKGGHSLVSLSPNVEQIKKTKSVLELEGFTRIRVVELLERELLVRLTGTRPKERMISHTAYLIFAQKINKVNESK